MPSIVTQESVQQLGQIPFPRSDWLAIDQRGQAIDQIVAVCIFEIAAPDVGQRQTMGEFIEEPLAIGPSRAMVARNLGSGDPYSVLIQVLADTEIAPEAGTPA
ncbi:hypothetical protein B5V01_21490 [Mesorhizobium erdmanii]|uniref:Uncharacterized protein n=2 Tax=Mesorhizobium TaxID=68287 RepID=A0A3M9X1N8_9HYPH|nr:MULTISPECIES: hypothetical protein [Mesorhizobium]RNJ41775.1 hypothetical protein DNR46_31695 [Mesorhizobium japonicum]RXT42818.1 hypothetical protein B5V01_21490 [Mesorhizobium erdmanii]